MKIALCATSIHPLISFKLLRACASDVKFFVACDQKTTPDVYENEDLLTDIMSPNQQMQLGYKCSEACGWNTMSRRNIAFLEALKDGADVIVAHDVDNYPTNDDYFRDFERCFAQPLNGLMVGGYEWFDPGSLLIPKVRHRGFPHGMPHMSKAVPVTGIKVGVAAGLIIGNPDVDATTRLELKPDIGMVHVLGDVGVVVDKDTLTVFNTQSTAVIRELIPAWFLMPGVGRMDDIYASMIVQRVARERDYHVHFGRPLAFQQRHDHNLIKDLRAEIDGMENVKKLATLLDHMVLPGKSVIEDTCYIYSLLQYCEFLPRASVDAALLWIEDCADVL